MKVSHTSTGPLFVPLLPTAVLQYLHMCSMGFRSWLITGHIRIVQHFLTNWVLFEMCLPAGQWPEAYDLWWRQLSNTDHYIAPKNSLVIRFHDNAFTSWTVSARNSRACPKHLWATTTRVTIGTVLISLKASFLFL